MNPNTSNPNKSQLLEWIFSKIPSSYVDNYPLDFLDDHIKNMDSASMDCFFGQLYDVLRGSMNDVSAFGNFQRPLNAFLYLVNHPVAAKALVNHKNWIPEGAHVHGRDLEVDSILGPFFHVNALPDKFNNGPDIEEQFFSTRLPSTDLSASFATIKTLTNELHNGLARVLTCLLENCDTRVNVVAYLAQVINKNSARARMQFDAKSCASSCMFVNLGAVMLRVCQPLSSLDDRIDPKYVFKSTCLNFRGLTALNASESEVVEWFTKNKHGEDLNVSVSPRICEDLKFLINSGWFFMTARVLNLGLIKELPRYKHLVEKEKLCYEAQIVKDEGLVQRALCFYRLMMVWLVGLVGGFKLPLPTTCPKEFVTMPEHFVEDAMELLLFASRNSINFDGVQHFIKFIIMFMAAPDYIRNLSLREKMVEVLYKLMKNNRSLFEGHQLYHKFLVKNLIKVYVDVECTSSHTRFAGVQYKISKLLGYLWKIPSHREAWIRIAKEEEKGIYLNFLNFLMDNSVHLFESLITKIPELQEQEADVDFEHNIQVNMRLVSKYVSTLAYTSEKIATPFLRPEMVERVASMLNYFLSQLVGLPKKCPRLNDPAKYESILIRLLKKIVNIYINLVRGDKANIFPAAIVKDVSYNEGLFSEALSVLQIIGEDEILCEFLELEYKAKVAATKALEAEASLGEIPDEFLDPIQYTFMMDPVILTSSGVTVDRPVIKRHLLSSNHDPFNRSPLSVDMLQPNKALKAQIDDFIRSRELKQDGGDCIMSLN